MPERIRMHRDRPWRRDHPDAVIVDCHARVLIDIANESLPLAQAREGTV